MRTFLALALVGLAVVARAQIEVAGLHASTPLARPSVLSEPSLPEPAAEPPRPSASRPEPSTSGAPSLNPGVSKPALHARRSLGGQTVQFKTKDGWTLAATWQPPTTGKTFLLLPMLGGRRGDWEPLARALAPMGHGYLAIDLRGHGDSTLDPEGSSTTWRGFRKEGQDNEFNQMVEDAAAAAVFLSSAGVSESSVVVCGAALGANVGLKWAVLGSSVPALVLLSPGINYRDVLSIAAMRALGPRAVLIVAGSSDRKGWLEGQLLYNVAKQYSGPAYADFVGVPKEHGTKMLDGALVRKLLEWVRSPVKTELLSVQGTVPGPTAGVSSATATDPFRPEAPAPSTAPVRGSDLPLLPLSPP